MNRLTRENFKILYQGLRRFMGYRGKSPEGQIRGRSAN